MTVQAALEWAFGVEFASLDLPDRNPPENRGAGFGMEYVLMERARLGTKVDSSRMRSRSHDDAEVIAAIVSSLVTEPRGRALAIRLVEVARSGLVPDWMPGARPKIHPESWRGSTTERRGRTEVVQSLVLNFTQPHPKNPKRTIRRQKKCDVLWVPCTWEPTLGEIIDARRDYEFWWQGLDLVRLRLKLSGGLDTIRMRDVMPPRKPWARVEAIRADGGHAATIERLLPQIEAARGNRSPNSQPTPFRHQG